MNQEPLTIEELKTMAGLPVWCPDEEAYGIVMCDSIGQWAGIPFLHGVWYHEGVVRKNTAKSFSWRKCSGRGTSNTIGTIYTMDFRS